MANPPNIVLVVADQQRADMIGAFGQIPVRTPVLDRLCNEGTAFRRAYTATPICTPTRATLLSGQYPSRHGAWSIGTDVPNDVLSLPRLLAEQANYRTALIGKSHLRSVLRPGSIEALPKSRDWDFYREWSGPWYGFEHARISNGHVDEPHAYGLHYGLWLHDNGIPPDSPYFLPHAMSSTEPDKEPSARVGEWELPEKFHSSTWAANEAISYLEDHAANHAEQPFYLAVNFADPHRPFRAPAPWHELHDDVDLPAPSRRSGEWEDKPTAYQATLDNRLDTMGWQLDPAIGIACQSADNVGEAGFTDDEEHMWRVYLGMQSLLDKHLGRICDSLDQLGLAENTLLVYTADHGDYMGDHWLWSKGASHYDGAVRVPCIVRWPGRVPAGHTSHALQSLVDLPTTFLSAAGLEVDPRMQGIDQLPCWTGETTTSRPGVLIDHRVEQGLYVNSWITDRYRLSVHSIHAEERDEIELYDLAEDPHEYVNLAAGGANAPLVNQLMQELIRYRMQLDRTWRPRHAFS
ncbi:sulfatase [Phytoactinopolyspora endophytica]|uniref:sulfatase family protein n=1 Tax=Phytoactinopolyspora endophytica TaxID=1642495 RepID=UPI00101C64C0|nr:sulfatase-like hydrolase/transferase [Phytoactinopolyspora endophytica]